MITFVIGGTRSGKSRYALELAGRHPHPAFLATAEPIDPELQERIRRHRADRAGRFHTVEEPLDLAAALRRLPEHTGVAVVDCLTVWLGNVLHHRPAGAGGAEIAALLAVLGNPPCPLVLVSNEVGSGGIHSNALARQFTDLLGHLNQQVAARADRVVLVVSGVSLVLKGASA